MYLILRIFNWSSHYSSLLGIVLRPLTVISIAVNIFFSALCQDQNRLVPTFSLCVSLELKIRRIEKFYFFLNENLFSFSGCDLWVILISGIQRIFLVSFSRRESDLSTYHVSVLSNFNILEYFCWILFPTRSYWFENLFCSNVLHSLIMWLTLISVTS